MRDNGLKEFPDPDAPDAFTLDAIANGSSVNGARRRRHVVVTALRLEGEQLRPVALYLAPEEAPSRQPVRTRFTPAT